MSIIRPKPLRISTEHVKDTVDFQNAEKLTETLEHRLLLVLEKSTDVNLKLVNIPLTKS